MKRAKLKFVVGSAVILAAVFALAITGMEESTAYYHTVLELKAMGARAEGRRVRVAGDVVVGSIERLEEGEVSFVIDHEGETLTVHYVGRAPLPDTLVERAQAVAEGKLEPDGTFVQAKCASKDEADYGEASLATPRSSRPSLRSRTRKSNRRSIESIPWNESPKRIVE